MVLFSTGVAKMAIYYVPQSHSQQVWFRQDFAGKGVLNILGGVLPNFVPIGQTTNRYGYMAVF